MAAMNGHDAECLPCNNVQLHLSLSLSLLIIERISITVEQRLMTMHAGAINPKERFRHKGCMQTMLTSNRFNNQLERLNLVGSLNCIRIFKVNFMLAWSNFVMRSFNLKSHLFNVSTISRRQFSPRSIGARSKYPP